MNIKDWFNKVAYLKLVPVRGCSDDDVPKSWLSKFDDSYITLEGLEKSMKFLADREITDELTHGVGFSPKDKKWYGWSHRAIYGFEIGSECKKGDCGYIGASEAEQRADAVKFWEGEYHTDVCCTGIRVEKGDRFFIIEWKYTADVPCKELRGKTGRTGYLIVPHGRGEWTAKTMEGAKQMAIDFSDGVS